MLWCILFIILLNVCTAQLVELDKIRLNARGEFVDSRNFVKLFRGFNSVIKFHPFYDVQAVNESRLALFQQWGINVIRLGVIWCALQPTEFETNHTYLNEIQKIVNRAAEYGIYIILDLHQDVLSSRFGTYDGIPSWLLNKLRPTVQCLKYPWPFSGPLTNVMFGYLTYDCVNMVQQIYENVSSSWDYWGDYWELLARTFVNKSNVLGYELINEPPVANFYKQPLRLFPAFTGRQYLSPIYNYLVSRIRKYDKETLIFYEPIAYSIFGFQNGKLFGTGIDKLPGSDIYTDTAIKSVLSYHYYCWPLQSVDPSHNMSSNSIIFCDKFLLPTAFKHAEEARRSTGGGKFLTEFGLCEPDGNPHSINTIECNAVLRQADEYFESWTYWNRNFLDRNGNPILTQIQSFIRPYPKSTNGQPVEMSFRETGNFRYTFNTGIKNATSVQLLAEIYIPISVQYESGIQISIEPSQLEYKQDNNTLYITAPGNMLYQSLRVSVNISRSQP